MSERVALGKRVRFEVFKRDSFTCQYCGRSAPEIVLNVDHIKPVAEGGTNDLVNLITSCFGCNSGKSDVPLDDSTAVAKQKRQLDELQERRSQLEMMMEWHRGLVNIESDTTKEIAALFGELTNCVVNDNGLTALSKVIKRYGVSEVIEAVKISAAQYDDHNVAFEKIGAICFCRRQDKEKPWMADVRKIRAILKAKCNYFDDRRYFALMNQAVDLDIDLERAIKIARDCRNWSQFINSIQEFVDRDEA